MCCNIHIRFILFCSSPFFHTIHVPHLFLYVCVCGVVFLFENVLLCWHGMFLVFEWISLNIVYFWNRFKIRFEAYHTYTQQIQNMLNEATTTIQNKLPGQRRWRAEDDEGEKQSQNEKQAMSQSRRGNISRFIIWLEYAVYAFI